MDPNANLAEQNEILAESADTRDRARLRELRTALYDWIYGGGFQPQWSKYPTAAAFYGKPDASPYVLADN